MFYHARIKSPRYNLQAGLGHSAPQQLYFKVVTMVVTIVSRDPLLSILEVPLQKFNSTCTRIGEDILIISCHTKTS